MLELSLDAVLHSERLWEDQSCLKDTVGRTRCWVQLCLVHKGSWALVLNNNHGGHPGGHLLSVDVSLQCCSSVLLKPNVLQASKKEILTGSGSDLTKLCKESELVAERQ